MPKINEKKVLLNVRDLTIEFRNKGKKFQAVKGVNFDIYKGEIFGLVGESGSGKTTIGRAISGVQSISDGSIYLDNEIVAGSATSLYKLNKEIFKKIKFVWTKYSISCSYVNRLIDEYKQIYQETIEQEEKIENYSWTKKVFNSQISQVHKLTKENLQFVNEIIKDFKRINQFIFGISKYIPEISPELENSILAKNNDTLDIVIRLRDKISLDFKDIDEIKNKIKVLKKNHSKNLENVNNPKKVRDDFLEFIREVFDRLKLVKENDDRIKRRIKIALRLEEQNLDLSSPKKFRKHLINKYSRSIYVLKNDFLKEIKKVQSNPDLTLSKKATNFIQENADADTEDFFIKDTDLIDEFYTIQNRKNNLNERQTKSIEELINYLKLPSIDELVSKSYIFGTPSRSRRKENRRCIQMIFQDPGSSLNERMSVEQVISEGLENFPELYKSPSVVQDYVDMYNKNNPNNQIGIDDVKHYSDVKKYVILNLVNSVGLLPEHLSRYPHEFSGGQKQRIGIARSLALKPKIIVADEPISALDVSIRAQVLNLFKLFEKEYDLTYLFITHDLSVVKFIADRIAVIYHGDIVEMAESDELFKNPLHPYTRSLLSAIPHPDPDYNLDDDLIVYDPEKEHYDYIFDIPEFIEVSKNHFVLANKRELENIKKTFKK